MGERSFSVNLQNYYCHISQKINIINQIMGKKLLQFFFSLITDSTMMHIYKKFQNSETIDYYLGNRKIKVQTKQNSLSIFYQSESIPSS